MAHELAHVLLRHGTANATKAQGFQIGALAGAIAGAVIGGGLGADRSSQGSQFGLGTWLMKYSRDYEKQADLLGAQIMARAGYDPRDLAHMFETIQQQGGGGGAAVAEQSPEPRQPHAVHQRRKPRCCASARVRRSGLPANPLATCRGLARRGRWRKWSERRNGGGNGGGKAATGVRRPRR